MRLLGLLGGTSWVSTSEYYRVLNLGANKRLGGVEAAKCVIWSLNFGEVQKNNYADNQAANYRLVLEGCRKLQSAGAEGVIICANTMHMFADDLRSELDIPLIHLVEAVRDTMLDRGQTSALLLGTKYTMEGEFYHRIFREAGIQLHIPDDEVREVMHGAIYNELTQNIFTRATRDLFLEELSRAASLGCQVAILGCTEIPILLQECETALPLLDTLLVHADAALDFMLSDTVLSK